MAYLGRDHHEVMVVAIWKDILGEPPRDLDDDFFAAGGDSLTATIFVSRLSASVDGEIGLEDIYSAPTPRALAACMRGKASPAGDGVVCMRPAGAGQRLILLPVGAGMGFLAGDAFDRPVLAVEPIGVRHGPIGPADLDDLAPELARRIQALPHSPGAFQLIGRCAGSLIALAVVSELEKRGEMVSAVHLFDPQEEILPFSQEEMIMMRIQAAAAGLLADGETLPETPEQLFERLRARGENVLTSTRAQFAQRNRAIVATQYASMQFLVSRYAGYRPRCPVYAYVPSDSTVMTSVPLDLYGSVDLRLIPLGVPRSDVFSDPGVAPALIRAMCAADEESSADPEL
jgi:hypothetical protein